MRYGRIRLEEDFEAIAAGKHPQDLIHGDACHLDAGLSVIHLGGASDPIIHSCILRDIRQDCSRVGVIA